MNDKLDMQWLSIRLNKMIVGELVVRWILVRPEGLGNSDGWIRDWAMKRAIDLSLRDSMSMSRFREGFEDQQINRAGEYWG